MAMVSRRAVACLLVVVYSWSFLIGADTGSISGSVRDAAGYPVKDAVVEAVGLPLRWSVGEDGTFEVRLPPGDHRLLVTSAQHGSTVTQVHVVAGRNDPLDVRLSPVYRDEIVVSAGPEARPVSEVAQPIAVLSGDDLDARQQPSLGATIEREPGVSTTSFGPAVGRPVLRGLGGDRVRILSNGTDAGDLSAGAPDHAVDASTATAERIEILRGAATLLYGSSAGGGVVNVIDGRIPETRLERAITGSVAVGYGSAGGDRHGDAQLSGSAGALGWSAAVSSRRTRDFSIPGWAAVDGAGEHDVHGTLHNSSIDNTSGVAGLSWIGSKGFLGLAVSRTNGTYGLPGELEEHGGDPQIVLEQSRLDLRGELRRPDSFFEAVRLSAGANDYSHVEAEGSEEFGQRNSQQSHEARVEVRHADVGRLSGAAGIQVRHRDIAIVGEEAFVPPSTIDNTALFVVEELAGRDHLWQGGLRYEQQRNQGEPGVAPRRTFRALSSSLGFVWTRAQDWSVGVSVARAVKFPSAEELYSEGPHLSTRSYEIGDADLEKEVNLDAELSIRRTRGRVTGELNLFVNRFEDFIFQRFTGDELEELPVLRYENGDATFSGLELRTNVLLLQRGEHHLSLELGVDSVRAELRATGEPLPRIPPLELGGTLRYDASTVWAEAGVWRASRQTRVAPFERPTNGYTALHAAVGRRIYLRNTVHAFLLRGSNLNNAEIRTHTSFLKDLAPQPGRDFNLSWRVTF
jgi:iron complex outermembrane recepter protein